VANTQAKYGPQIAKDIERSGKAIGAAAMSGKGDVSDAAKGLGDMYRTSQKTTAQAVKEGKEAIDKQTETAAKPTTKGDPTAALLDAIEVGATAAKEMQQKVVGVIGEIAEQLRKHYDGLKGAFDSRNYTGDMAGGGMPMSPEMLAALVVGLALGRSMLQGAFAAAMNKVRTGSWLGKVTPPEPTPTPTATTASPSGPGGRKPMTPAEMEKYNANRQAGMSSAEAKRQAQGFKSMNRTAEAMAERTKSVADGLAQTGPRATTALNTASKEVGVLGKSMNFIKGGFEKVGKKLPLLGSVVALGTAGFQIFNTESRLAAGEISKEDARKEEGGIVGGAAGAAAGGWGGAALGAAIGTMILPGVGTAIGGLLGGAIGAWGGEELGSKLGESLMSHWGDITEWTSKFGKSISDGWTTAKNWLATDGKQYWNMFTSGAKQVGSMALGILEQIPVIGPMVKGVEKALSSAKEHFLSAGKSISGFLSDSAAKFKQTFPELTAGVASVVEFMTAGLGKLVDYISNKAGEAWGWVKEKTGFGDRSAQTPTAPNATTASPANSTSSSTTTTTKNTSAEKPATGPGTTNLEGEYKKNADSWVAAVQSGKSFDSVPEMYKPYVKAQLAKGTPKAKPVTTATPTSSPGTAPTSSAPSSSTPPPKVETAATPQKKELTAQEKAAVYETIATNTKYTADLLQSQIRSINSMAQQLAAITEATRDTATAAKKTAQRVN
jgi:rubrerythrin